MRSASAQEAPASTPDTAKQESGAHAQDAEARTAWIKQVVTRIQKARAGHSVKVKSSARVQLSFVVAHDGHLVGSSVQTSSGLPAADHAALAIVKAAAPFPKMPSAMTDDTLTLNVPIRFTAPAPPVPPKPQTAPPEPSKP